MLQNATATWSMVLLRIDHWMHHTSLEMTSISAMKISRIGYIFILAGQLAAKLAG
jgi:hypothetical protein